MSPITHVLQQRYHRDTSHDVGTLYTSRPTFLHHHSRLLLPVYHTEPVLTVQKLDKLNNKKMHTSPRTAGSSVEKKMYLKNELCKETTKISLYTSLYKWVLQKHNIQCSCISLIKVTLHLAVEILSLLKLRSHNSSLLSRL